MRVKFKPIIFIQEGFNKIYRDLIIINDED
jgi:hypothetical protein